MRNTPSTGPWEYENVSDNREHTGHGVVRDANGNVIFDSLNSDVAEIYREDDGEDGAVTYYDLQGEADLKLAAAAPDLLTACRLALGLCQANGYGAGHVQATLAAAIAKSTT